ncbi:MAG: hypothetical protein AAFN08_04400 [Cyanobacteria bacterium J06559_3]
MLNSFLAKLKNYWSTEVPASMAACEFDCRKLECTAKDWETCPKRQQREAALKESSLQG